jgi:hypothetical protein
MKKKKHWGVLQKQINAPLFKKTGGRKRKIKLDAIFSVF